MNDLSQRLGEAMCAAWGLNPAEVFAIDVHWRPRELPTATVRLMLNEGVVREMLSLAPVPGPTARSNDPPGPTVGT